MTKIDFTASIAAAVLALGAGTGATWADQVIPDDLIVQGSICSGFDCLNNESFGFDTFRMKENNTRIKFEDTSVGTFPATDWQLTANDSASGGQNKFSIEDVTSATIPLTILGAAPSNAFFMAATGKIGLRTATPVLDLHMNTSDTPAIRFEQNSSGGFTGQTWDVAGNEANFFVRDLTGGSRLPFRIRPGAPTSSIDVASVGRVGIGNASPVASLDVVGNASTVAPGNGVLRLSNGGIGVAMQLVPSTSGVFWNVAATSDSTFNINRSGNSVTELSLSNTGNLVITGTLTTGGPTCASGCDAVFEPDYRLPSIGEHADSMWANKHLPNVEPTLPNAPVNLSERFGQMLNELETAHIYIEQLHKRISALESQMERKAEN